MLNESLDNYQVHNMLEIAKQVHVQTCMVQAPPPRSFNIICLCTQCSMIGYLCLTHFQNIMIV